jgi:arabinan endo-1,5-alpha-L-arabinosidase
MDIERTKKVIGPRRATVLRWPRFRLSTTQKETSMFKYLIAIACLFTGIHASQAVTLAGLQNAHDPGTVTRDGDTYFNFTTGSGIWYSTSRDLVTWQGGPGPVFPVVPAWIKTKIPGFGGEFWAPDVTTMNGYYYLYYSVSTFGSSSSAIGVARSRSLKNPAWEDLGMVVESFGGSGEINAIDPALLRDQDGKVYLSYGSFFGGIGLAEIDQRSGKLAGSVSTIWGGGQQDIEAPYIVRDGAYYYLYVNRGRCCQGSASTYYVQVQRATNIRGPYSGTRTVLANTDANFKGPGHVGVLKQDGCNFVSTHYYDLNDGGKAKLQFHRLSYSGGWPVMTRDFPDFAGCGGISDGPYAIASRLNGKVLGTTATANGTPVVVGTDGGTAQQTWYVVGHGDGDYSIIHGASLRSLDNYGNSTTAGTVIALWDYWAGNGQLWRFASAGSPYLTLSNRLSGMLVDVKGASQAEGAPVIQYSATGAVNQQWQLRRR